jgi:hypothetical protein
MHHDQQQAENPAANPRFFFETFSPLSIYLPIFYNQFISSVGTNKDG